MKVSHVLFKTNNLKKTIKEFEKSGFKVEYGSKKKPHNALIYFSDGPYIEILEKAPVTSLIKLILRFIGKGYLVERFNSWEQAQEGFFEICLENKASNFRVEKQLLNQFGEKYFVTQSKRKDPLNRVLKWKLLFPSQIKIPFLMTPFNINPKPKNFVHPNKINRIKQISYCTEANIIPIINELCNDDRLQLSAGKGECKVTYE
ncbi:VOC family protein [Flavobacteriaceae bacterium]|nr:VOC family protein [Flavobacteriaceae bacterium]